MVLLVKIKFILHLSTIVINCILLLLCRYLLIFDFPFENYYLLNKIKFWEIQIKEIFSVVKIEVREIL